MFALLVLLTAGAAPPPEDLRPLLRQLYNEYRWLGLPLPPRGARLVRIGNRVGFLYRRPRIGVVFLYGDKEVESLGLDRAPQPVKPAELTPGDFSGVVDCVVQCYAAGQEELTLRILRGIEWDSHDLRQALKVSRLNAFPHWVHEAVDRGRDWSEVASRLRTLRLGLGDHPMRGVVDEFHTSLQLSITTPPAKRGSIESLFDALIRDRSEHGRSGYRSPPYDHLCEAGFTAVPALIRALGDNRLTRRVNADYRRPAHHQVANVASKLLREIAGYKTADGWRATRGDGPFPPVYVKEDVEKWWASARQPGEERFYTQKALNESSPFHLQVLARKYPRLLVPLYQTLLNERPGETGEYILAAIMSARLPRRAKRDMVLAGSLSRSPLHRLSALPELMHVNPRAFLLAMKVEMERMPKRKVSRLDLFQLGLARLIEGVEDDEVWAAFEAAVERADPTARSWLLTSAFCEMPPACSTRRRALAVMARYLGNRTALPDDAASLSSSAAAPTMRNLTAQHMGRLLGIDEPLPGTGTREEWDAFAAKVEAAWKREKARLER